jgi:hypothetical protein
MCHLRVEAALVDLSRTAGVWKYMQHVHLGRDMARSWQQPDAALTGSVLLLVACHLMACPDVGLSLLADAQSLHALLLLLLLLQSPG